jgi:hypothetical protein
MSNSLRANAERLLGDVQRVHTRLVAQIERVERATGGSGSGASAAGAGRRRSRGDTGRDRADDRSRNDPSSAGLPAADDGLEVPEFIPPG